MKYSNFPIFIHKLSNREKLYRCFLSINKTIKISRAIKQVVYDARVVVCIISVAKHNPHCVRTHLCWAKSMSMLVTLLWCVPSFWPAFCFLMHKALRGARNTPITSKLHPTTIRAVEFCAASAPGASCTRPTTNTTAPNSNDPTTTCKELTFENIEKAWINNQLHSLYFT